MSRSRKAVKRGASLRESLRQRGMDSTLQTLEVSFQTYSLPSGPLKMRFLQCKVRIQYQNAVLIKRNSITFPKN